MSTSHTNVPYTYEDYKILTATSDRHYELINGDLYMNPSPTVAHQVISMNIVSRLERHVSEARCGRVFHPPLDVVLGQGEKRSVVQPDIMFVSSERKSLMTEDEIAGAPDLIVEILSPGTARRDLGVKKALYAQSGVVEYWIVNPELGIVDLYSLADSFAEPVRHSLGETLLSHAVPGFELTIADVFRDLP